MGPRFEDDWSSIVCGSLDRIFLRASAGFQRTAPETFTKGVVGDMLWEAEPVRYAERYPDSGVVESYGGQWPPVCIDYWVYVDTSAGRALVSIEGWDTEPQSVDLTGHGLVDAGRIGGILEGILDRVR